MVAYVSSIKDHEDDQTFNGAAVTSTRLILLRENMELVRCVSYIDDENLYVKGFVTFKSAVWRNEKLFLEEGDRAWK